jgi:ABC-type Mn2+/Zn2+ transport system permease subunit
MIDDFKTVFILFPHAVATGVVISVTCSALGVFTILKRVVFVGITLSEVAACGIALGMAYHMKPFVGAVSLTVLAVALLSLPFESHRIPRDAVLGVIFVFTSALAVLVVSKSGFGLHEVKALLYGDLILTSTEDLYLILGVLVPVLIYLIAFIRPTLYTFLDREYAKTIGIRVARWELMYFLALGLTVSAASKVAGAILIFCFLVVTPTAGLLLARRMKWVMLIAVLGGLFSTFSGIYWSFIADIPTNQAISVIACFCFVGAVATRFVRQLATKIKIRQK